MECTIYRLATEILDSLEIEIDRLSADAFDDDLMSDFESYLDSCEEYWVKRSKD